MYRKALTGLLVVLFAGFLFSGVFSIFNSGFQSIQGNINVATTQASLLAY